MSRISARRLVPAVLGLAVSLGTAGLGTAAAAKSLSLKKVSPTGGPEFSSFPVTVHGSGFSTEPGATRILFGETAAGEVTCKSSSVCTALSPELAAGPTEVTVEVAGQTSNGLPFTYEVYSPPVAEIVEYYAVSMISPHKLTDRYPAIFTPGNIYLQIMNRTGKDQTLIGPTGPVTIEPGLTEGYNLPVEEASPYVFELEGALPKKGTLSVKTKTPR